MSAKSILRQNPIVSKDLRSRMRGVRAVVILTIYLLALSILVSMVYLAFAVSSSTTMSSDVRQTLGKTIFSSVVILELCMVCLISPALTAGAISAEHEHQTYDLLRTTLLSARDLVLGKLASSLSFMLILVLAALPLQMLGFFFGGVSMEEIIVAFLILVFSALAFNALGIFFSSFIHRTLPSTVLSYVTSILLIFGVPVILWFLLLFGSLFAFGGSSSLSEAVENILLVLIYVVGYTVIAINPLSTVVASEIMLIERQSIFYTTLSMGNNWNFPVVAPWITYLVFYTLLSILLISVSILFVKRTEK